MSGSDLDGSRYCKILRYLDSIPAENRRVCPVKDSRCACRGCVSLSPLTIKQRHLDMYESGELRRLCSTETDDGDSA